MKKFNLLMLATMVAFGAMFTSCSEEDEPAVAPKIDQFTADLLSVTPGSEVTFTISASAGSEKLEKVVIMRDAGYALDIDNNSWSGIEGAGQKGYWNSSDAFQTIARFACATAGTTVFTATAYDKNGLASEPVVVAVTVSEEGVSTVLFKDESTLKTTTQIKSAATAGANQCFYSISLNATETSGNISNGSDEPKYDFIYWNNSGGVPTSANAYSIYAPSNSSAASFCSSWIQNKKNATLFKKTTLDFETATKDDVDSIATTLTSADTKVSQLAVGTVVLFKTAATSSTPSKIGLFKVTARTEGYTPTDYIEIQVRLANY